MFAGDAFAPIRLCIDSSELALKHAVDTPHLLLFPQLRGIARGPRLLLTVLTGRITATLYWAFVGEALLALQKQLLAFTPALAALCVEIPCHIGEFPRQMRRFLGGRQPLCGTGVTSEMLVILNPTLFSARTADSRPGPGPLIRTSRFFTPDSWA